QTRNDTGEVCPGAFGILKRNVAKINVGPDAGRFSRRCFAGKRAAILVRSTRPDRLIWTAWGLIRRQCSPLGSQHSMCAAIVSARRRGGLISPLSEIFPDPNHVVSPPRSVDAQVRGSEITIARAEPVKEKMLSYTHLEALPHID